MATSPPPGSDAGVSSPFVLHPSALKGKSPDQQQSIVFMFLTSLEKSLAPLTTPEMKANQVVIEKQLIEFISTGKTGAPLRRLISRCFRLIYQKGDSRSLNDNIANFLNISKGTGGSKASDLASRLAAIHVIGHLCEHFGKQLLALLPDIAQVFLKLIRAEGPIKAEVAYAFASAVKGIGQSGPEVLYKDILKAARSGLSDKNIPVRIASVACLVSLINNVDSALIGSEFESIVSASFKALDGSNYSLRRVVADLLGKLLSATQSQVPGDAQAKKKKRGKSLNNMSAEDMLSILGTGFVKASGEKAVRVGIAEAYAVLFKYLGPTWIEANASVIIQHIVGLSSNPKTCGSIHEETSTRECFGYILKSAMNKHLNEEAKLNVIKELVAILKLYPPTAPTDPGPSKQALVVVLNGLSELFQDLGHAVVPVQDAVLDPLLGVSGHPSFSVRQAVAWCFRTLALATPANLSKYLALLIQATKASHGKVAGDKPETLGRLRGHSICLSALVACIPHCLLHVSFVIPEEILAFAVKIGAETNPDSGIVLVFQEVSWALLAALTCLGPSFIKSHLNKYVSLWQQVFSKNTKDANVNDEDWKNTVRARECALACLEFFLKNCFALLTTDLSKKITNFLNTSLVFLALVPSNKFSDHILKLRLFHCFLTLPPASYELSHVSLLRSIVDAFTNSNTTGDTPTSLFFTHSNRQDATLFGWNFESDEEQVEKQLQYPLSGAIEFDPHIVCGSHQKSTRRPTPVPPEIAVVDSAIELFEKIFPIQRHQNQEQILEQLVKSFKAGRATQRKYCLQINTFTAVMGALKTLMNRKSSLSRGKVSALLQELVQSVLVHQDGTLRYAAAETLGRLTGVVGGQFVSSLVKSLLDNLISSSEPTSRAGYLLAIGCVMRYVGGMGASSHLQAAVGILLSLSSDSSPVIYTWAIHSLWIAIDSAGLMFQPFVSSTLALVTKLFLTDTHETTFDKEYFPDLNVSVGRLLGSLMVALGPELQTSKSARELCLSIYSELEHEREQSVVAEAIPCIQQLILFAPATVDINAIVPVLQKRLENAPLSVRKACYGCLRQLIQREPKAVNAAAYMLEEQLYASFDSETNEELAEYIQEMIVELLSATALTSPSRWIDLTRQILTSVGGPKVEDEDGEKDDDDEEEGKEDADGDDGDTAASKNKGKSPKEQQSKPKFLLPSAPRWQTKVFAVENIRRVLLQLGAAKPALVKLHFNLGPARELKYQGNKSDFLIFRLNELIRIAFNAATSPIDGLHSTGLDCLQEIIERFAPSEDPDYEEHSIMEQYQAQISAALRPAFAPDSSPDIISRGCAVTALYIRGGIISEIADLKRVVQLLTTMLEKFKEEQDGKKSVEGLSSLSPHAHLIVKLAVLTAWADLYVSTATKPQLVDVVEPYLSTLSMFWVQLLCDFAEIKVGKTSPAVREVVLPFFKESWTKLLEAVSRSDEGKLSVALRGEQDSDEGDTSRTFFVIFALCVEALFEGDSVRVSSICLTALGKLLKPWLVGETFFDKDYFVELLSVLNRMAQTDEGLLYVPVIKLIKQIVNDHSVALFSDPVSLFGSPMKTPKGHEAKIHNLVRILTTLLLRHIPGASQSLGFSVPPSRVDEAQSILVINSALEALTTMLTLAPARYQADLAPVYLIFIKAALATESKGIRTGCTGGALQSLRSTCAKFTLSDDEEGKKLLANSLQKTLLSLFALIQAEMPKLNNAAKDSIALVNNALLASVLISTGCPAIALSKGTLEAQVQQISSLLALNVDEVSQTCLHCSRSLIQLLGKPETAPFGATFAKALIPEVILVLTNKGSQKSDAIVLEAIKVLSCANAFINESQKQGIYSIVIPTVVSLLQPHSPSSLHTSCLQQLLNIGSESPQHFKSVVALLSSDLKEKLETSVRLNASQGQGTQGSYSSSQAHTSSYTPTKPTIQLKMNFSNFN